MIEKHVSGTDSKIQKYGSFVFPDGVIEKLTYAPYEYATQYVGMYARVHALHVIELLTFDGSEFAKDHNHLFFAMKRNAQIANVNLIQVHMATYLAYADYIGATQADLIEVLRGISDNFESWVPDASMHESVAAKIRHYGFHIKEAIFERAAKLDKRVHKDDFTDTAPETLGLDDVKNLIEQNLANEQPNLHPICHIAKFGEAPKIAVDEIVWLYEEVWARDGFPSPVIGNAERQYFEFVIAQSIRTVLAQLTGLPVVYNA